MTAKQGFLSPASMSSFIASLHGMASNEVLKAKELYIMNAISDYKTARTQFNNGLVLQIIFFIIPLFWPFLIVTIRNSLLDLKNMKNQISNAIEIWGSDMGEKKEELERLLHNASSY